MINLYDFQRDCVDELLRDDISKIIIKSPTGSGKTVMLLSYIDEYLNKNIDKNICFVWLTPGKGELEEQSMKKLEKLFPLIKSQTIQDILLEGFSNRSVSFINWEVVTKKGNKAITENEISNLFDRIDDAKRENIEFIVLVDEEDMNKTKKAQNIIDKFNPIKEIRFSATANKHKNFDYYEIDEVEVINSGLITRAMYINMDVTETVINSEYEFLLDLAINKRNQIEDEYRKLNKNIVPLVIIQFPNGSFEEIKEIENYLEKKGYTYENGELAKWLSDEKMNLENIVDSNAIQKFLIIKQAISTGWDCPRAKILVKLRDSKSESFEIQTIGRIRRMPEGKHYNNDILDCCYLYTLDEKYKQNVMLTLSNSYEVESIFLKDEYKDFKLEKEDRDINFHSNTLKELLDRISESFAEEYKVKEYVQKKRKGNEKINPIQEEINKRAIYENNINILEHNGFTFSKEIENSLLVGKSVTIDGILENNKINIKSVINNKHREEARKIIIKIGKELDLDEKEATYILQKLFTTQGSEKNKFLTLKPNDYKAFLINNKNKLFEWISKKNSVSGTQLELIFGGGKNKYDFYMPKKELVKKDENYQLRKEMTKNVYKGYTTQVFIGRSVSEMMLENYLENSENVLWYYKNGDKGKEYFSIVYYTTFGMQKLFYPDYIVKLKNGDLYILEAKGGEIKGESKNIDKLAGNKFDALKMYANEKGIKFGFIRCLNDELYINNTNYEEKMSGVKEWKHIEEEF